MTNDAPAACVCQQNPLLPCPIISMGAAVHSGSVAGTLEKRGVELNRLNG